MDVARRLEVVEAENDVLRERVAQLEAVLAGGGLMLPVEWRLSPAEATVFGVLWARPRASKDAIMAALYRDVGRDEPLLKITEVYVCKLRAKLRPHGITISGAPRHGGWMLTPEGRERARELLAEAEGGFQT